MKRLIKLVRTLTVLAVVAFSLSVYFAYAAEGDTTLCGETSLYEPIWGDEQENCPCPLGVLTTSCEKDEGTDYFCQEFCCSSCYYPGIQPE